MSLIARKFPFLLASLLVLLSMISLCNSTTTTTTDDSEGWTPPVVTLNTEVVVECPFRDSGVYFSFTGLSQTPNENGKYCYHYQLNRFDELWNCDEAADQTWSYLIMDPCPNTANGDFNTLITMQRALGSNSFTETGTSGTLGAFYDSDWEAEGYLFENINLSQEAIHIELSLCLDEIYPMIDNGNWCFYSYYNKNATIYDSHIVLPSGRILERPRRGRLDVLNQMENNRRRRRLNELKNEETINNNNNNKEKENEILELERLIAENENRKTRMDSQKRLKHSHSRRVLSSQQTNDNNNGFDSINDEFSAEAAVSSGTDGGETSGESESEAIGNGVTYFVCATETIPVPNICGE